MDIFAYVGFIAGLLTTCAAAPQVVRAWRLKDTRALSLPALILSNVGTFLWMCYGIGTGLMPVIAANTVSLLLLLTQLGLKLRYK